MPERPFPPYEERRRQTKERRRQDVRDKIREHLRLPDKVEVDDFGLLVSLWTEIQSNRRRSEERRQMINDLGLPQEPDHETLLRRYNTTEEGQRVARERLARELGLSPAVDDETLSREAREQDLRQYKEKERQNLLSELYLPEDADDETIAVAIAERDERESKERADRDD